MKYKGKEYKKGDLRYEGDYFDGKSYNGKGKESNTNKKGDSIFEFELEYINGKYVGYAKKYYDNHNLEFKGEYKDDVRKEFMKMENYVMKENI